MTGFRRSAGSAVSDVVDAVLFLESSPYITGEILHIDGGQSAGDRGLCEARSSIDDLPAMLLLAGLPAFTCLASHG